MTKHTRSFVTLSAACISMIAAQSASAVAINEFRVDHVGDDTNEYFELFGTPGESLNGLTYIVIGDVPGGGAFITGAIEVAIPLDGFQIGADGFFLSLESIYVGPELNSADLVTNLNFENSDNLSHLLVSGFTGVDGDLVDSDQDGLLDAVLPWTSIIDGLALEETQNSTEFNYGPQLGIPTMPAAASGENAQHVFCSVDGAGDWTAGFVELGAMIETPGSSNVLLVLDADDNDPAIPEDQNNFPDESDNHGDAGLNMNFLDGHASWVQAGPDVLIAYLNSYQKGVDNSVYAEHLPSFKETSENVGGQAYRRFTY